MILAVHQGPWASCYQFRVVATDSSKHTFIWWQHHQQWFSQLACTCDVTWNCKMHFNKFYLQLFCNAGLWCYVVRILKCWFSGTCPEGKSEASHSYYTEYELKISFIQVFITTQECIKATVVYGEFYTIAIHMHVCMYAYLHTYLLYTLSTERPRTPYQYKAALQVVSCYDKSNTNLLT